jgi:hypothetical protein
MSSARSGPRPAANDTEDLLARLARLKAAVLNAHEVRELFARPVN